MSSSDFATDGALGVLSTNINPFVTPGVIRPTASPTTASTNLVGNLVASSDDSQTVLPSTRIGVGSSGVIFSWDDSTWTQQITALSNTYSFPETDIAPFYAHNYVTSTTKLMQVNTSAWTKTENFQSLQDGSALHPLLVYQASLFVGDGKHLANLQSDESTWNADSSWVLNGNEKIVALGIDPTTGLMMVSVENAYNPGDSIQQPGIVYLYDGVSSKPIRKIIVDDLITSFQNVEGTVFVGTGSGMIGQWNGNGVTFLRKLMTNGTFLKADLPYKHHMTNLRNILLIVDGLNILAYGAVVAGKRGFFYIASNTINSNNIGMLMRAGSNKIGLGMATSQFETFDIGGTGNTTLANLYFNNIYFPRPIYVHRMRLITTGIAHTGNTDLYINIFDEKDNPLPIASANRIFSAPTGTTYVKDFDFGGAKCQGIQPVLAISNNNYGIVRVIIYYDVAE